LPEVLLASLQSIETIRASKHLIVDAIQTVQDLANGWIVIRPGEGVAVRAGLMHG
jgi:hypothetical protein